MGAAPAKSLPPELPTTAPPSMTSLEIICNTIQQEVGGRSIVDFNFEVANLTAREVLEYRAQGQAQVTEAWAVLNLPDWKVNKRIGDDVLYSMMYTKPGRKEQKIFKVVCHVAHNAKAVWEDVWHRVDKIPEWDTALMESHKVCTLDEFTDVTYQVTNTSASGLVTPRDFVNLRGWRVVEGVYVVAHAGINYPTLPKTHQYIRGENGVCCVAIQIDQSDVSKSIMHLLINTKLNGWIPQKVIDVALVEVLFKYLENLRDHIEDLRGVLHDHHPERRKSF